MNASKFGTPPVRALFFEFPNQPELFGVDRQFMIGRDILVTPVLAPNASTVQGLHSKPSFPSPVSRDITGIFPGRGKVFWRDWYTHDVVQGIHGSNATAMLSAPLGHIPVHVREGAALLLHGEPGYTIEETRRGPFKLLVVLSHHDGRAFGTAYLDDGDSDPPGPSRILKITATDGQIRIEAQGQFKVESLLKEVVVLGTSKPGETNRQVRVQRRNGRFQIPGWAYDNEREKLVLSGLDLDLNQPVAVIEW
jgi:alpha-glucosidase